MLEAKNIKKRYGSRETGFLEVLKGISLSFSEGEIVAIVGQSGAGKSTLVHLLGLLDKPSEGEVFFEGKDVMHYSDEQISKVRNENIGFVFQFHHLLPEFSALENVLMPSLIAGKSGAHCSERACVLLKDVGLTDREHHKPSELSGGEQQRVAVARALMNSPKIIFADEPSGNLDAENAEKLHNLLFDLRAKHYQSFVIVTHNKELASRADRIITLSNGLIVQ
ncbi:MAG: ABC transporter ATP-binding protein [Bacteroidetes bacterium]|nr:ABC transporter ATP-binding protein [Bacteroidota bacterium]